MSKKITISMNEYTYDKINEYPNNNRSELIESLILKGMEYESQKEFNHEARMRARMRALVEDCRAKDNEIRQLKAQIGKAKERYSEEKLRILAEREQIKLEVAKLRLEKMQKAKRKKEGEEILRQRLNDKAALEAMDLLNRDLYNRPGSNLRG